MRNITRIFAILILAVVTSSYATIVPSTGDRLLDNHDSEQDHHAAAGHLRKTRKLEDNDKNNNPDNDMAGCGFQPCIRDSDCTWNGICTKCLAIAFRCTRA